MNPDPTVRKVVQIAEQAQLPVHVPVVLGNDCFVVTQQDVRRIEDSRLFSYNKLNAKGELVPMDTTDSNDVARDILLASTRQPIQFQPNTIGGNHPNVGMLSELIARACNVSATIQQQQQQQQQLHRQQQLQQAIQMTMPDLLQCVQPQLTPTITVTTAPTTECNQAAATFQQQLDWAKACNSMLTPASMYPLHHTSATSTTEIARTQNAPPRSLPASRQCCTRACNTMDIDESLPFPPHLSTSRSTTYLCARQQAKQRKMAQFEN